MTMKEPMLKYVTCPVCKTFEPIEVYSDNLDGRKDKDGVIRAGNFWQEGFYIYHCKGEPIMEIR